MNWIKSSYSTNNGACVEMAAASSHVFARDSKNTDGPVLTFAPSSWAAFLTTLSRDR